MKYLEKKLFFKKKTDFGGHGENAVWLFFPLKG